MTARRGFEIDLIRRLAPDAAIHYNNPVRARHEIAHAVASVA
jgi:ornithine decarboxylase